MVEGVSVVVRIRIGSTDVPVCRLWACCEEEGRVECEGEFDG